jgi:hypothetical protein
MGFSISIVIKLKNQTNHLFLENLIEDAANNCNMVNFYKDFELEGINNYIKKNNTIIILEFDTENDIINFIKLIKTIKELDIEYIYENNNILYATNRYLNSLDRMLYDKNLLQQNIETNKKSKKYTNLYKII